MTDTASEFSLSPFVIVDATAPDARWNFSGPGVDSAGIFNPALAGIGPHVINVEYETFGICTYNTTITIIVNDLPVANAGSDLTLDCAFNSLFIGSQFNVQNPQSVSYNWLGGQILSRDTSFAEINNPGAYVLLSQDSLTGCSASDTVIISTPSDFPNLRASVANISCFGRSDGAIVVDTVSGGLAPYTFALNNNLFDFQERFSQLGAGRYDLVVQDANFCMDTMTFEISEPDELTEEIKMYLDNFFIEENGVMEWGIP